MPSPTPFTIAPETLASLVGTADAPILIDARRRDVFEATDRLIAGAVWRHHLNAREWSVDLPIGETVVVYCVHGHNVSQGATAELRALGLDARQLAGGIDAFVEAGGTTISKADPTIAAHDRPTRWITRERPKIDRVACPWLIRRFVDPAATFLYVASDWVRDVAVEFGAIPYDIPDTVFSHVGERCSFDAFVDRFAIIDPALRRVATIVRGADTGRLDLAPECAGLLAMALGVAASSLDDRVVLERGMAIYDALYSWARSAAAEEHSWRPETLTPAIARDGVST